MFRDLKASEIKVRVGNVSKYGATLLLYKDARVDMDILDEFYPMLWKRSHNVINDNMYCTVSLWNKDLNEWISREDCGVESKAEAEKGEASDSFKRACFNWGIGRELYTPLNIKVDKQYVVADGSRFKIDKLSKFSVVEIEIKDSCIIGIIVTGIYNDFAERVYNEERIVFSAGTLKKSSKPTYKENSKPIEKIVESHLADISPRNNKQLIKDYVMAKGIYNAVYAEIILNFWKDTIHDDPNTFTAEQMQQVYDFIDTLGVSDKGE